jgi:hypothetical protein
MGYYENPPIIQPNRGGEIIGASIAQAGESIAQGLIARGERKRAEEKEQRLTLQKLQDRKNETDLFYNEKMSKWSEKQSSINPEVNKQIRDIVQQKVIDAADARILLLNETNATKRQEYLTTIRNADNILENAAKAGKSLGGVVATWRLNAKASTIGKPNGYVVNGKDDTEILDNTAFLESLAGMASGGNPLYKSSNIKVSLDDEGDGFVITANGEHSDGRVFNVPINTKSYIDAEENLDDGLLLPVESMDTFFTQSKETIVDKKGNIYDGFLQRTRETVDLPSSGGDIYQIQNGQRLQENAIKKEIDKKSQVTAAGILSADNPSKLKALLNYSLEQGPQYYDQVFKARTPEEQKSILTSILTEKSFSGMVKSLERTTNKDGSVSYWNPTADIKIKEKPVKTGGIDSRDGSDKNTTDEEDYRSEYYNNLIYGIKKKPGEEPGVYNYRSRKYYTENLNRLAGSSSKFITTDDLYKKFLQEPIKEGASLTFEDQIKAKKLTKEDVKKSFNSRFPKSDIYYEQSPGDYRALTNYNINKASSRAKMALDFTAGEGEVKKLQGKVGEASLADWINDNPKGPNETDQQYVTRYKNSLK